MNRSQGKKGLVGGKNERLHKCGIRKNWLI